MARVALEGHAHGARLDALADDCLHGRDLVLGRMPLLGGFAHDVAPHRGVADQRSDIQAEPLVQRIEILRDGFPGPFDSGLDGFQRDRFDMG